MHHAANVFQAVLYFSAGVGAKSLFDWYLAAMDGRKG